MRRGWIRGGRRVVGIARKAALPAGVALSLSGFPFASPASASAPCTTIPSSGGQWPMYGHDVANTRSQPEGTGLGPSAVVGLKPAWVFSTSSTGDRSEERRGGEGGG